MKYLNKEQLIDLINEEVEKKLDNINEKLEKAIKTENNLRLNEKKMHDGIKQIMLEKIIKNPSVYGFSSF